jgi:hypothetical protein
MAESKRPPNPGVGKPAYEYLQLFGDIVWDAFGSPSYLVGSALYGKKWRDVDMRVILEDKEWELWGLGDPVRPNNKCRAFTLAFSELGRKMTGLPVDFQIQQQTMANEKFKGGRSALFTVKDG